MCTLRVETIWSRRIHSHGNIGIECFPMSMGPGASWWASEQTNEWVKRAVRCVAYKRCKWTSKRAARYSSRRFHIISTLSTRTKDICIASAYLQLFVNLWEIIIGSARHFLRQQLGGVGPSVDSSNSVSYHSSCFDAVICAVLGLNVFPRIVFLWSSVIDDKFPNERHWAHQTFLGNAYRIASSGIKENKSWFEKCKYGEKHKISKASILKEK